MVAFHLLVVGVEKAASDEASFVASHHLIDPMTPKCGLLASIYDGLL